MFLSKYLIAIEQIRKKREIKTVVDLFGGSGLLSHAAKRQYPGLDVIYNDYDRFTDRLSHVHDTNRLLAEIRGMLSGVPKQSGVPKESERAIKQLVPEHEGRFGYVDYITLSASLLFSGKYVTNHADLAKCGMYNCVKLGDYDVEGYLEGLTVTHVDYFDLYEQYKDQDGVLFVIDPPYLSTDSSSYKSDKYWRLTDYLKVLKTLDSSNYIFFTSNKSQLVDLCSWIAINYDIPNPFAGATMETFNASINHSATYTDMMLYKVKGI